MGNNCPCLDIRSKHEKLWHEVMTEGYEYKCACCCGGRKPRLDVVEDLLERGANPDYRSSRTYLINFIRSFFPYLFLKNTARI